MSESLLSVSGLHAGYGRSAVLHGVDLEVASGEMVALIGSNGAGKSTLLKAIVGLANVTGGAVTYDGVAVASPRPERLVRAGLALVPEGRLLFGSMSVRENLELGAFSAGHRRKSAIASGLDRVSELFPVLAERSSQPASTLSGGEQQMLAVGRALMSGPRMLLLDEPSLGLAPRVIGEIFAALRILRDQGVTVLLVEQDARLALKHSDRGYVMRTGRIELSGPAQTLLQDDAVSRIYLGGGTNESSAS